jgi:predicted transcriptional regulator
VFTTNMLKWFFGSVNTLINELVKKKSFYCIKDVGVENTNTIRTLA